MGHVDIVKLLLDANAEADTKNAEGGSALQFAAGGGNFEGVKLLVEAGADVNSQDTVHGTTVLMLACAAAVPEVVEYLLEKGADIRPLDQHGEDALKYTFHDGHRDPE